MPFKKYIRSINDYPKKGVIFRDITTLLLDPQGYRMAVDAMIHRYMSRDIDAVAGIEARGFILGGAVAHQLGKGFIPVRKKGKLPWQTMTEDYELEYGLDSVEIHTDAISEGQRILLVDDLLATGGTAQAAIRLIERSGAHIEAATFVIELPDLGGRKILEDAGIAVHALTAFEGA